MKLPYQHKFSASSSHSLLTGLLREFSPGTNVLDVGTASGMLGRECQGRGLLLKGIEPVEAWATLARPYYQAIATSPLAQVSDDFLTGHQVVVCADVLEHMPDPHVQLARLVALQPGGAVFLISVPNVANLWVRLHLLAGHFDYTERGILDRTHLRFFTRHTLVSLVESSGLQVESISPTSIPLELIHPFFSESPAGRASQRLLAGLTRLLPTILGYQFVLKAIKPI